MARNSTAAAPRQTLLRKRLLTLADFAKELRRGVKLSSSVNVELYGSKIAPIPVPLKPNESLELYESQFVTWLTAERAMSLEQVQSRGENTERNYRITYARQRAHDYNARRTSALAALDCVEDADMVTCDDNADDGQQAGATGAGQKRSSPNATDPEDVPPNKRLSVISPSQRSEPALTSTPHDEGLPNDAMEVPEMLEVAFSGRGADSAADVLDESSCEPAAVEAISD